MKLLRFLPLLSLPLSTFINLQSMTVPMVNRIDLIGAQSIIQENFNNFRQSNSESPTHTKSPIVLTLSIGSILFGVIGNVALFVRMLEKKIKICTRLMMIGAYFQGIFAILTLILFHAIEKTNETRYTEAIIYKLLAGLLSLISGSLTLYTYLQNLRHHQIYVWVAYELSYEQRQFILLTIASMTYMSCISGLYSYLENWAFDTSLYWCISTFLTIGFGDYYPKSDLGLILFPPISFFGVMLTGSSIYAMRNVFLEVLAVRLANRFLVYQQDLNQTSTSRPGTSRALSDQSGLLPEALDIALPVPTKIAIPGAFRLVDGGIMSSPTEVMGLGLSLESSIDLPPRFKPPGVGPSSSATIASPRLHLQQGPSSSRKSGGRGSNINESTNPKRNTFSTKQQDKRTMTISRSKRYSN